MTLLPAKLKQAGYETHMIGKGHLGYQTTDHLPIHRGFDTHLGYLEAAEHYYHGLQESCDIPAYANLPAEKSTHGTWPPPDGGPPRAGRCHFDHWENAAEASPEFITNLYYSTNIFAERAIAKIEAAKPTSALYIHLTWQAVHGPYTPAPAWESLQPTGNDAPYYANYCPPFGQAQTPAQHERCDFGSMLKVLDNGMKNVTDALVETHRWESLLMIVSADNGGIGPGNNHPLRGSKMTPWQGGTRVTAFLTGGFLPENLRGTSNSAIMHIADWYPTLCNLVGVSAEDNVILDGKMRPLDGVDVWPLILSQSADSPHEYLPTTEYSIIWQGRWKLLTNAAGSGWYPPALGFNDSCMADLMNGTEGYGCMSDPKDWPCVGPTNSWLYPPGACAVCSAQHPCLFDLLRDEGERHNLASTEPAIVAQLAKAMAAYVPYVAPFMNETELANYDCLEDPQQSVFPSPWWGNFSGPCCRPKTVKA